MHDPRYEQPVANPAMVGQLVEAVGNALESACIPDVTTTADVLSALFTCLDHALRASRKDCDPVDAAWNAKEINRVLLELLVEFGDTGTTKH